MLHKLVLRREYNGQHNNCAVMLTQVYDADLAMYPPTGSTLAPSSGSGPQLARVYDPDQGGFMTVDLCKETEDQRTERLWAEGQLRQLRIGNRR